MPNGTHQSRRAAIREMLHSGPIETQAALVEALEAQGFAATQSSVSRDLRELGAIKSSQGYILAANDASASGHLVEVGGLLREINKAGNHLLVIRTAIGAAQRVALALDRSNWAGMVGTIAGDDTIFVATDTAANQNILISRIEQLARQ